MKAITVKQPWASLIVEPDEMNPGFGIKPIENRTWKCPKKDIGKRVLIHAAKNGWEWIHVLNYLSEQCKGILARLGYDVEWLKTLPTGAIIGSVEIVDCVINHQSIWAEKSRWYTLSNPNGIPASRGAKHQNKADNPIYNWVLANPIKFDRPIPCKGKLSFWEYEGEIPE